MPLFWPILLRLIGPLLSSGGSVASRFGMANLLGRAGPAAGQAAAQSLKNSSLSQIGQALVKQQAPYWASRGVVPGGGGASATNTFFTKFSQQVGKFTQQINKLTGKQLLPEIPPPTPAAPKPESTARSYGPSAAMQAFAANHTEERARAQTPSGQQQSIGVGPAANNLAGSFGKLSGVAIRLVARQIAYGTAVYAAAQALGKFADEVLDAKRYLAEYNAGIAAGLLKLEFGRVQRNIQAGKAQQGSLSQLSAAINDFEREIAPITNMLGTLVNTAGIIAAKAATGIALLMKLHPLTQLAMAGTSLLEKILGKIKGEEKTIFQQAITALKPDPKGVLPPRLPPAPILPKDPIPPLRVPPRR